VEFARHVVDGDGGVLARCRRGGTLPSQGGRKFTEEEKKRKKKPFIPASTSLSVQWIMREQQGDAMQNDGKSHI
jgi:hypothetical protein